MANNFTCSKLNNFDADVAANQAIILSQVPGQTLGVWKAIPSESWVTLNPDSGTGAGAVIVLVDDNTTGKERSAVIIITETDTGEMETVSVIQDTEDSAQQVPVIHVGSTHFAGWSDKIQMILKKAPTVIIIILLSIIAYSLLKVNYGGLSGNSDSEALLPSVVETSTAEESKPASDDRYDNNPPPTLTPNLAPKLSIVGSEDKPLPDWAYADSYWLVNNPGGKITVYPENGAIVSPDVNGATRITFTGEAFTIDINVDGKFVCVVTVYENPNKSNNSNLNTSTAEVYFRIAADENQPPSNDAVVGRGWNVKVPPGSVVTFEPPNAASFTMYESEGYGRIEFSNSAANKTVDIYVNGQFVHSVMLYPQAEPLPGYDPDYVVSGNVPPPE